MGDGKWSNNPMDAPYTPRGPAHWRGVVQQWTTTPPTDPGWYWTLDHRDWESKKRGGKMRPTVVHVVRESDGLHCWVPGYDIETEVENEMWGLEDFTHWLGPLPEPKAPSD